jgi:prevent-host-death family protein
MTSIPAIELQTNLDAVLSRAQRERIIISRGGKPCAVLVGIENYDAEDLHWAGSQDFWRMIRERRAHGKSIPLAEVEARLEKPSRKPAGKRVATKKLRKRT